MKALVAGLTIIFGSWNSVGAQASPQRIETTLLPIPGSPLVSFRLLFRVGSVDDPEGIEGLAMLTAKLLKEGGTEDLTSREIQDLLYPIATEIRVQVEREVTVFSATVHRDNLEEFYQVFRDLILHPRFDPKDLDRLREEQLHFTRITLRSEWDEELGKAALQAFIYENHPYGHPVSGTVKGLNAIKREDILDFYKKHYTRSSLHLGLAGGYPAPFPEKVLQDLRALPQGRGPRPPLPLPNKIHGIEILIVDKRTRASAISMGFPIRVRRGDRDFVPLFLANVYFGDHRTFHGVLMEDLRVKRGLNYGDYSYIEHFIQDRWSRFPRPNIPRRQQYFSIWIRPVQPENAHFTIRAAIWELERLIKEGLSPDAFQRTREYLLNYSKLWTETQSRRLGYLMDGKLYGTQDLVTLIEERLPDLTLDEVNESIRKHLNFKNLKVVVVSPEPEELKEALLMNLPSPIHYQREKTPADVLLEDREIEKYYLRVNREMTRIVKAEDLFEE